MCGIAGILSINNKSISKQELQKMNNTAIHRGPDADGFFIRKK